MDGKPERGRAFGSAVKQWGCIEMLVPFRSRPHRRQRDHVGEIQCADGRLADIGVDMPGQRAEPRVDDIDGLCHRGEVAALDYLLDQPELLGGDPGIVVPHRDGRGHIGLAGIVGAELLQGHVGVGGLVGGVRIDQRGGLVGHHLLEDGGDRLALGEPLPPDLGQQLGGVGLVEEDRPRRPAIGRGAAVQLVEDAGCRRRRETDDSEDADMRVAEAGLEAAGEWLIGEQRIEIHRRLGDADAMPFRRERRMQVGERLGVIEPHGLRHEGVDEIEDAIGAIDEAAKNLVRVNAGVVATFIEPGLGARGVLGWRQVEECEELAGLEMRARLREVRLAFGFDQRGGAVGEHAGGIGRGAVALRLDKDGRAGAEEQEGIVRSADDSHQLGRHGAVEIGAAEPGGALKAAVLVQHHPFTDQCHPGQEVREAGVAVAIFSEIHHRRRSSDRQVARDAQMLAHDVDELRIALGRPDGGEVPYGPKAQADQPEAQAEAECGRERAVEDGERARRATQEDVLGERPMDRDRKSGHFATVMHSVGHQTSAPPPKEKKDRKKLDAAKAIDRPNTIWIRRRAPPDVSPNARVRPVMMMIITAMILATGPSMDSTIDWSGASHGIDEPDAWAAGDSASERKVTDAGVAVWRRMRKACLVMTGLL
eukprot:Opistho-2@17990